MKSTKTTKSYEKRVRYYIIRRKLLHYQARGVYYINGRKLLHYRVASLLHYVISTVPPVGPVAVLPAQYQYTYSEYIK